MAVLLNILQWGNWGLKQGSNFSKVPNCQGLEVGHSLTRQWKATSLLQGLEGGSNTNEIENFMKTLKSSHGHIWMVKAVKAGAGWQLPGAYFGMYSVSGHLTDLLPQPLIFTTFAWREVGLALSPFQFRADNVFSTLSPIFQQRHQDKTVTELDQNGTSSAALLPSGFLPCCFSKTGLSSPSPLVHTDHNFLQVNSVLRLCIWTCEWPG